MAIQIVLQNDCRRRRIEPLLARAPVLVPARETTLGFATRQPFVLKHHVQSRALAQLRGKCLDPARHVIRRSVEPPRQPDHNRIDLILFETIQSSNFVGGLLRGSDVETGNRDHTDRASQQPCRIADRDAYPALPGVEADAACHAV